MKILLIGAPASGKGTIGKLMSEKLYLPIINTGKILKMISPDSIWYKKVNDDIKNGKMVSSPIVASMLQEICTSEAYAKGFILDGWVRQLKDLEYFDPQVDLVIFLNIDKQTAQNRIFSRRECVLNKHTYSLISAPPKKEGICDIDGSELVRRVDDSEEVFAQRWEVYSTETLKAVDHYRQKGILLEVAATPAPVEIFAQVMGKLQANEKPF